ncbi:hypothetical protein B0H13DRAFT_1929839 [Mycena leptocephala]|nr:hypothetical protein B0H13DRAFT_1929839 [Mycena leptocephala]
MTITVLRARARKALRIFNAWRSPCTNTRVVRAIPLDELDGAYNVVLIPGTQIIVLQEGENVFLRDWNSQAESYKIPLELGADILVLEQKVFWVESIRHTVLVVHSLNTRPWSSAHSDLHLFAIIPSGPSAIHLITIALPFRLYAFSLSDSHLAVLEITGPRSLVIQNIDISYHSLSSTSVAAMLHGASRADSGRCHLIYSQVLMSPPHMVSTASLAILDRTHLLLATYVGIAVFNIADHIPATSPMQPVQACWEHQYAFPDINPRPLLGPVVPDPSNRHLTVSILGGNGIHRLSMTIGLQPSFILSESTIFGPRVHFNLATGLHVGIYRRASTRNGFATFPIHETHLHPLAESDLNSMGRGLVKYPWGPDDTIESVDVDEGEGRLVFIQRKQWTDGMRIRVVFIPLPSYQAAQASEESIALRQKCPPIALVTALKPLRSLVNLKEPAKLEIAVAMQTSETYCQARETRHGDKSIGNFGFEDGPSHRTIWSHDNSPYFKPPVKFNIQFKRKSAFAPSQAMLETEAVADRHTTSRALYLCLIELYKQPHAQTTRNTQRTTRMEHTSNWIAAARQPLQDKVDEN